MNENNNNNVMYLCQRSNYFEFTKKGYFKIIIVVVNRKCTVSSKKEAMID